MIIPIHSETAKQNPRGLRVLASTFPMALFTKNVANGAQGVEVELMLSPNLGCPHDYVLTPQDMEKIRRADVFIANGLGLEEFLGEALLNVNPELVLVDTSRGIEDLLSMERDSAHSPGQEEPAHHRPGTSARRESRVWDQDNATGAPNPHLFASPRMAARIVMNIAAALASADPANARKYKNNADLYASSLRKLGEDFEAAAPGFKFRQIVAQHAVFDYLARDIGLDIVAVVQEHPGQEPSAAEMMNLVKVIRQRGVAAIFTEPQYPSRLGAVLAREAGVQTAELDPVASGPENAPLDHYERTMRVNLATVNRILGHGEK